MVKVSVIVPAYKSVKYIERCLRSLEDQTLDPNELEVILVIDGPDQLMNSIVSKKFSKVLIVSHEKNLGLPSALNTGLVKALGQYVLRVDSDDYVESHYLEYLLYAIESNPDYEAVHCDYIEVDLKEKHTKRCDSRKDPIGCGIIFSRQSLLDIGLYNVDFQLREEEELMIRFEAARYNKLHLPLPLYRYRKHTSNISNNTKAMKHFKDKLERDENF